MTQHAKYYSPSSAPRYINCPNSPAVAALYPNDESDASLKGDIAHAHLETGILFGVRPRTEDPDMDENIATMLDWSDGMRRKGFQLFAERKLDIPETGDFGTTDVCLVSPDILGIADYKNGYVLVNVRNDDGTPNEQLMTYLLGAIAFFGERPTYFICVLQPNASHVDGAIRSTVITPQEVDDFRAKTLYAVASNEFRAGKWCKKTYCPHRGGCATFHAWNIEQEGQGWFTSEINQISDDELRTRLDYLDTLQGQRDEARKEAMRRILNMDRNIPGYKMVKGSKDRSFVNEATVKQTLLDWGATDDDLYTKKFTTVKGAEDFVKKVGATMGRGKWKDIWEQHFAVNVREYAGGLTLERATDARPAHKRGSEFGQLTPLSTTITQTV